MDLYFALLLVVANITACLACFGVGWFARGQAEARTQAASAIVVQKASQEAQAVADHETGVVDQETAQLGGTDSLGTLLGEKVRE